MTGGGWGRSFTAKAKKRGKKMHVNPRRKIEFFKKKGEKRGTGTAYLLGGKGRKT